MARARRGAEEGRHRPLSARHGRAIAALDGQPELHHAARLDVARAGSRTSPTSASSTSIRPRTIRKCCGGDARRARPARELGLASWVKTSGSKGFHVVVPLDGKTGIEQVARFAHARRPRARRSAIRTISRRSSARPTAAAASTSTPAATATARRLPRPTPCAPGPARRFPRPAPGKRSSAATVTPRTFTLRGMAKRIADVGDLWADLKRRRQSLRKPIAQLERISSVPHEGVKD